MQLWRSRAKGAASGPGPDSHDITLGPAQPSPALTKEKDKTFPSTVSQFPWTLMDLKETEMHGCW